MKRLQAARLVYVATPFTLFPGGPEWAFVQASQLTARLVQMGVRAFSPIVHSFPLAKHGGIDPLDGAFWLAADKPFMGACDVLAVGALPTWEKSTGIKIEVETFLNAGKPVYHLDPVTLEVTTP